MTINSSQLRRFLANSGFCSFLYSALARNHVAVLLFHRVLNDVSAAPPNTACSVEMFEGIIGLLRRHFRLLSPKEFLTGVKSAFPRRSVLLTFDDGYADVYDNAFDVLRKHDIKASIFVTMDLVGEKFIPWWDRLWDSISHQEYDQYEFDGRRYDIGAHDDKVSVFKTIATQCQRDERVDVERIPSCPKTSLKRRFLTVDNIREMLEAGWDVGWHGRSHRDYSLLSSVEVSRVLEEERRLFCDRFGVDVRTGAFPFGAIPEMERADIARTGFDVIFSTEQRLVKGGGGALFPGRVWVDPKQPEDLPYALARLAMNRWV